MGFLDGQIAYSHSPCWVSPVNIFPGTFVLQVINILYFFSFVTMQCKVPRVCVLSRGQNSWNSKFSTPFYLILKTSAVLCLQMYLIKISKLISWGNKFILSFKKSSVLFQVNFHVTCISPVSSHILLHPLPALLPYFTPTPPPLPTPHSPLPTLCFPQFCITQYLFLPYFCFD